MAGPYAFDAAGQLVGDGGAVGGDQMIDTPPEK